MEYWYSFRSLLKAFIRGVKPDKKFNGKGEYNRGWNDAVKAVTEASNAWFKKMDKEN